MIILERIKGPVITCEILSFEGAEYWDDVVNENYLASYALMMKVIDGRD